jgi:hypothetical protein
MPLSPTSICSPSIGTPLLQLCFSSGWCRSGRRGGSPDEGEYDDDAVMEAVSETGGPTPWGPYPGQPGMLDAGHWGEGGATAGGKTRLGPRERMRTPCVDSPFDLHPADAARAATTAATITQGLPVMPRMEVMEKSHLARARQAWGEDPGSARATAGGSGGSFSRASDDPTLLRWGSTGLRNSSGMAASQQCNSSLSGGVTVHPGGLLAAAKADGGAALQRARASSAEADSPPYRQHRLATQHGLSALVKEVEQGEASEVSCVLNICMWADELGSCTKGKEGKEALQL